jgi:hypothetical protein
MFVDFVIAPRTHHISYDPITNLHSYTVKIIDDNFEQTIIGYGVAACQTRGECKDCAFLGAIFDAIIKIYSQRNLNIGKALYLCFCRLAIIYPDYNLKMFMKWFKRYYLQPELYENEIKKYLLFS